MPLQPGSQLGHYEIVSALGAGGMGEVYRARDNRLGRDVAVKVLPETVAEDPERLGRFEREARALAALNHPNVATLPGLESAEGTYQSSETSPDGIFLRPFPRVEEGKWQVSDAAGGFSPVWGPRGDELFYRTLAGRMMRVTMEGETSPELGRPQALFESPHPTGLGRQYDLMPDGEHFLMQDSYARLEAELVVVLGWKEEPERLLGEARAEPPPTTPRWRAEPTRRTTPVCPGAPVLR